MINPLSGKNWAHRHSGEFRVKFIKFLLNANCIDFVRNHGYIVGMKDEWGAGGRPSIIQHLSPAMKF